MLETLLANLPMGILVYKGDTGNCVLANQTVADMVVGALKRCIKCISRHLRPGANWPNRLCTTDCRVPDQGATFYFALPRKLLGGGDERL